MGVRGRCHEGGAQELKSGARRPRRTGPHRWGTRWGSGRGVGGQPRTGLSAPQGGFARAERGRDDAAGLGRAANRQAAGGTPMPRGGAVRGSALSGVGARFNSNYLCLNVSNFKFQT
jgi:hypothetical protein